MATDNISVGSNIDILEDKKILQYPLGLGSNTQDRYGEDVQFMLFKINVDKKSTTLDDDKKTNEVLTATRQGIGVSTFFDIKNQDTDTIKKYGDAVSKTQWSRQKGVYSLDKVIVLPMPNEHSVNSSIEYSESFQNGLTKLGDLMTNIGRNPGSVIGDYATSAKNNVISKMVNTISSGATSKQALNAEDRLLENSKKEILFKDFKYRTFNFSFRMAPKNEAESNMVHKIIQTFRYYALPELSAGKKFYLFPAEFEISFMKGSRDNPFIPRITTSVLENISVNYAPEGAGWSTLPNGAPLSLQMNLSFRELELIDRNRVYNTNPILSGY